ncbi:MAG: malto-oligosyltrehalose trehalohydrolase [Rhizobacter sp.]|nr:malto-oligosyltrehalose trehalohydrolase [Rhizobacter sp.]
MNAPLAIFRSDLQGGLRNRPPLGAEPLPDGQGVHFRVWAPRCKRVEVLVDGLEPCALDAQAEGYFAGVLPQAHAGMRYRYRLDGDKCLPDPASRFQPDGPHGASEIVDPAAFSWTDGAWRGLALQGQVIYELHVGTFTREGSWAAAARELPALAELGVTAIEVMPVADFPGRFGWGYDGVCWLAPSRLYGRPDDFRRFVDLAHGLGLGVLLDVVYNHFGPDGCMLREFSDSYVSTRQRSEWGDTPNFDGPDSAPVRELVLASAACWIDDYHLDGLRLDATQSLFDESPLHILQELGQRVRSAAGGRRTLIVNENEPQQAHLVRPVERGGLGLDMIWNDDWHHSATVAATAQDEAYYTDYRGHAQELVSAAKHGFLYQGQWYRWQQQRRGAPAFDIEPQRFVHFLQNHDQIANAACGERLHRQCSAARWRALTALLLLGPQTPMLFQGQEFACSAPFLFFADHHPALAAQVQQGRREFTAQFANLALDEMAACMAPPHELATFQRCKLDHGERHRPGHREAWVMHRDLLRLRREDDCLQRAQRNRPATDGAVLGPDAFVLRFFGEGGDDRLLLVNLGRTLHLDPAPEPLLAPPALGPWRVLWSSQDPRYGGIGTLAPDAAEAERGVPGRSVPRPFDNWRLQGETTLLLAPRQASHDNPKEIE